MRYRILASIGAIAVVAVAARASASPLNERIWLQSYLSYPIEDVPFTAAAMGYLGHVKQVSAVFTIHGASGQLLISRETVARFYADGRAAEEVDRDLLHPQITYRATYRYNDHRQIAAITRNDYAEGILEQIDFSYDAKGYLVGARFDRDGKLLKRIAIANSASGKPQAVSILLPDGREISHIAYSYGDHVVAIAYKGDFGAARVTTIFHLDAQGRPVTAETRRRDVAPQADYDGTYRYTYLPDGGKTFHGVELHLHVLPHPTRCVFDRVFYPNGGAKRVEAEGDDITCRNASTPRPEVEFDAVGNFTHTRLGRYEHSYRIVYYPTPSM